MNVTNGSFTVPGALFSSPILLSLLAPARQGRYWGSADGQTRAPAKRPFPSITISALILATGKFR
jgi:hypothetical protein